MSSDAPGVIVLAAGEGTRMRSALPKVLHTLCGKPMAGYVIDAARALGAPRIVVVTGHGGDQVREALAAPGVAFVTQEKRLGTADAVAAAREALSGLDRVLVLNGDEPLVTAETLAGLLDAANGALMAFTSQLVEQPGALGRVTRDAQGAVRAIVQAADWEGGDGSGEVNWGQYLFDAGWLWRMLPAVPVAPGGEYYLTRLADFAYEQGRPAVTVAVDPGSALGVDDRIKLAEAERRMRRRILEGHMLAGVTIRDPDTTYIDADVRFAPDVVVEPGCHLTGRTVIATGCTIGPDTTLRSANIGAQTVVRASVVEDSAIGERVHVGPFAHVRGGAQIGDDCELGNYAEVKNSVLGAGVKMHHFSYVGDADVGAGANISAGIVTCNFDGVEKHRTTIGAGAFIGCDTMLVAPISIGEAALTGAGSVVTHDVPDHGRVAGVPARPLPPPPAGSER